MTRMILRDKVGPRCPNRLEDVKAVHQKLMEIGKIPCYVCNGSFDDQIHKGIISVQRHFMSHPDGVIDVNGTTHRFLKSWKQKPVSPGVVLAGRLKEAWDLVNPLLPPGSYCVSAYRSIDDQRRILHKMFTQTLKGDIIAKYGQQTFDDVSKDLLAKEDQVLQMVRGVGQAIAPPGKSEHQRAKAIDVGGPSTIDDEQVRMIKLVARANPTLLSGRVLKERNGCVHFEIH